MAITPVTNILKPLVGAVTSTATDDTTASAAGGFGDVLKSMISQAVDSQHVANEMSQAAASGANVPLQDVVNALSKAELTLQTMVAVRDKAIEAYQEILRMPI